MMSISALLMSCHDIDHILMSIWGLSAQWGIMKKTCNSCSIYSEFTDLLKVNEFSTGKLIIVGDFNFNWDEQDNPDTRHMAELIISFNLTQHLSEPTRDNHTLDWIITISLLLGWICLLLLPIIIRCKCLSEHEQANPTCKGHPT